jgi:hypothetical protein
MLLRCTLNRQASSYFPSLNHDQITHSELYSVHFKSHNSRQCLPTRIFCPFVRSVSNLSGYHGKYVHILLGHVTDSRYEIAKVLRHPAIGVRDVRTEKSRHDLNVCQHPTYAPARQPRRRLLGMLVACGSEL